MITEEGVLEALRKVNDPELHRDLVSLGMVKEIKVAEGAVAVTVELTTPACPMRAQLEAETQAAAATRVSGWRSPFWGRSRWTQSSAGGGGRGAADPGRATRLPRGGYLPPGGCQCGRAD